ncbi:acyl-CoA dehydrogenase [Nocardioides sp. dk4132]|uniref:acyl-CoA dehydrogenase family protein n=1 Tax=unclassified Nocardioides TaxID=2615069 RepID=UPI001296D327|nr:MULTISPECIES: acyl-CoA dehydrogenase family protein [unclassified Nocardioides]MQW77587.1 acyl-CoA dehydrogenase [Nocardioides sp. dk4132]QGA06115.1 acyl-CoA dehydrogenase [Nocardioides sp. dk884]
MQLDLNDDQKTFQQTARRAIEKEMPLSRIREMVEVGATFDRRWWQSGAELGWAAMLVPEELDGGTISGDGLCDLAIVAEEFGRGVVPGPLQAVNTVIAGLVEVVGEQERHAETIGGLFSGELIASWAVYEPGREWDPLNPSVVAKVNGDSIVIDGVKDRVEHATSADLFLVTASGPEGVIQVLVPADAAGVTVTRQDGVDLARPFGEVRFENVEVAAANQVGTSSTTPAVVERQFQVAVALQCAETAGVVGRAFEMSCEWAFDRYSFGRPLASYQALKHRWADQKTWLEAILATTDAAVEAVSRRSSNSAELVSVAANYVGDKSTEIIQDIVQLFGGIAITYEHDIHFYLRRATINKHLYGTPTEHRRRVAQLIPA